MKTWTNNEKQFLIDNYSSMIYSDIAVVLGRTLESVKRKLNRMGLKLSENERRKRVIYSWHKNWDGKNMDGENNPNWKGGISKNHYHYKKLQVARYPDRVRARSKVHSAIKSGALKKKPCEICGETKVFAHHNDYSKPLDVHWFCRKHHRELHGNKH